MRPLFISVLLAAMCLGCRAQKVMLLSLFVLLSHIRGLTAADTISPEQQEVSGREGQSVTLTCHYQTGYNYIELYWYKHPSDLQAPRYILVKGARSNSGSEHIPDGRYGSQTSDTSTTLSITKLTLADTALYYCALRSRLYWDIPHIFGDPIRLTVHPEDSSPVAPALFILSPAAPPGHQPGVETQLGPDVCLAANFRPKNGTMVLNEGAGSTPLSTDRAVQSIKQKTFFFAGFSQQSVQSCGLHQSFTSLVNETVTTPSKFPEKEPCTDCHPEIAKRNFYLLLFNGIRVVFTKALAFSTILTVSALLL